MPQKPSFIIAAMLSLLVPAVQAHAQGPSPKPALVVAISVDQFSADLFAQYRPTFTGGLKRLAQGGVFPKGYQSHAATETCPGHATILTGVRPGHAGIIANSWIDQSVARADKRVYCVEDPDLPGSSSTNYTVSLKRLRVETLGDRMKAADANARVIAVSGKDRAAVLMGGRKADQIWWWSSEGFATFAGKPMMPLVGTRNDATLSAAKSERPPLPLPDHCTALDRAVAVTPTKSVGTGRFARKAGDMNAFRASPDLDLATLELAGALLDDLALGRRGATDLLAIGLSATDYVGHSYGTSGAEMCIQMAQIDTALGSFFDRLDKAGIDYLVVLTADHGGHDLPERIRENAIGEASRVDPALGLSRVNEALAGGAGLKAPLLLGDAIAGDLYVRRGLSKTEKAKVMTAALSLLRAHPQVAAIFTHDELAEAPEPAGAPEAWSLLDEAKASFDPERSGDLVLLLKPRVTPITDPAKGPVATHGSPWDYDRRVPILFWHKDMVPFEQPLGVETVDIMPTLAAAIGLPLAATGIDGRCLDLIAGPETSCPSK
jgi:predicted AlkP superfamily pyrophosphatase or phosphodiesterase